MDEKLFVMDRTFCPGLRYMITKDTAFLLGSVSQATLVRVLSML